MTTTEQLNQLKEIIKSSKRLVVFTGAGISTASGFLDFKTIYGLKNQKVKGEVVLSRKFFRENPEYFFEWVKNYFYHPDKKPNIAHKFLASLENDERKVTILTQNVDGFHQQANSRRVCELHGTLSKWVCQKCNKLKTFDEVVKDGIYDDCGGVMKPCVTLYDEPHNEKCFRLAKSELGGADTLLVIGTRLQIVADYDLIENYFIMPGKNRVVINLDEISYEEKDKKIDSKMLKNDLFIQDDIISVVKNFVKDKEL